MQYAIDGIQRKASSTFKIDGFTGAVNGHFGSRDRRYDDTSESMWQRKTQGGVRSANASRSIRDLRYGCGQQDRI